MKRHGLLSVTALAIALCGYLLSTAAKPASSKPAAATRTVQAVSFTQDPAAQRWLRHQPRHWREVMLNH